MRSVSQTRLAVFSVEVAVEGSKVSLSSRDVVRFLAALSDENRFRIVELLAQGGAELSCGKIAQELALSPSLVSHHLGVLESAAIIDRRRNGLWTLNSLKRDELSRHAATLERLARPLHAVSYPAEVAAAGD
jgi:DNA-binding transcriptional ArsR family regulator